MTNAPPATWRMVVDLSAPVLGEVTDWPNNIAEPILEQIEKQCLCRVGWEPRVTASACLRNYDIMAGLPGSHYLDVQVGEFPTEATMREWREKA